MKIMKVVIMVFGVGVLKMKKNAIGGSAAKTSSMPNNDPQVPIMTSYVLSGVMC